MKPLYVTQEAQMSPNVNALFGRSLPSGMTQCPWWRDEVESDGGAKNLTVG